MPDVDRAAQISARLAAASTEEGSEWLRGDALWAHIRACDEVAANAPADLAWLLAERAELLRRVEAAERGGAVKALRWAGDDKQTGWAIKGWLHDQAERIENGGDL